MAQVMFRCPYTNKPIFAGIDLHAPSIRQLADYPISLHCPHCGIRHHGSLADGCLAEEPGPAAAGAPGTRPQPKDVAERMKRR